MTEILAKPSGDRIINIQFALKFYLNFADKILSPTPMHSPIEGKTDFSFDWRSASYPVFVPWRARSCGFKTQQSSYHPSGNSSKNTINKKTCKFGSVTTPRLNHLGLNRRHHGSPTRCAYLMLHATRLRLRKTSQVTQSFKAMSLPRFTSCGSFLNG